ncbi:hypothetical protein RJ641_034855 [Dillenia turbinata]|uniref:Uncharacterized protein n=1 Tax=Dillenia turbinata TaxID=194707 RepID=A0AAN8VIH6_9MAGN
MQMGVSVSRISPESSMRSHGFHNSGFRSSSFNRGYGRGGKHFQNQQPPPPQPPPPPSSSSRRGVGDVFMEAGRLALEYLVSKGLFSPSVIQESGNRISLRLGNGVSEMNSGRRRFGDSRGRRPGGGRSYGSEWGQFSDKTRVSPEKEEGESELFSDHKEEERVGKDDSSSAGSGEEMKLSVRRGIASKGEIEDGIEKSEVANDLGGKNSDAPDEINGGSDDKRDELGGKSDGVEEIGEGKEEKNGASMELASEIEVVEIQDCGVEENKGGRNGADLLSFCKFAKVPTRTRSAMAVRGSKIESVPIAIVEIDSDVETLKASESEEHAKSNSAGGLPNDRTVSKDSSEFLDSDMSNAPPLQSVEIDLGSVFSVGKGKCLRSQSFPDGLAIDEQEMKHDSPVHGRSLSMVKETGNKRALHGEDVDMIEGNKKLKEWPPFMVSQSSDYHSHSYMAQKQPNIKENKASPAEEIIIAVDQHSNMDEPMFAKSEGEPCTDYAEEKQLFPNSFKICDLNLMGGSDISENHDCHRILDFPSTSKPQDEVAQVDIDLSMSNNSNAADEYGKRSSIGKDVEVIDLENDSLQDANAFNNSERTLEMVYTGPENFPNHPQSTSDHQDNYGFMMSDFLGTDIPNCASVPPDINPLHNMGFHNGEGILGDDDPIYMSLGEIPISMPDS